MKKSFTDIWLKNLKPPKSGRVEYSDAETKGLVLRISPDGERVFSVIYRVLGEAGVTKTGRPLRGKQHRITLGPYPHIGLADARRQAFDIREKALSGDDPRLERREAAQERFTNTVEGVTDQMLGLIRKTITPASLQKVRYTLSTFVHPTLGNRPLEDVKLKDINLLLDNLVVDGKEGTAREVRKHLSRLFGFATERGIIPANPMAGMRRADLAYTPRDRTLNRSELRKVWDACLAIGYPYGHATRLLLLTGQRKSEIFRARWSEIDEKERLLVIPAERYKSRREHIVPLADEAWALVSGLPRHTGQYLFTTTNGTAPVSGDSKAKVRLDALLPDEFTPWTYHDLRRTCETTLAQLKFPQDVRDAVLGHAQVGLQRTYNKYDYLAEKREALAAFGKMVEKANA